MKWDKVQSGFTIIELLFVFAVISVFSTLGIASFVSYSRAQALTAALNDVMTALETAKSRASSQVVPASCQFNHLQGYNVTIVNSNTFELHAVCETLSPVVQTKKLYQGISFDPDTARTTTTSITFNILTGITQGYGQITLKGYNNATKVIMVDTLGTISSN